MSNEIYIMSYDINNEQKFIGSTSKDVLIDKFIALLKEKSDCDFNYQNIKDSLKNSNHWEDPKNRCFNAKIDFSYMIEKDEQIHVCSICGKEYTGYGNNAQPVNDGRCCDECNMNVVIPKRMEKWV